jgi:hypothetical protein
MKFSYRLMVHQKQLNYNVYKIIMDFNELSNNK